MATRNNESRSAQRANGEMRDSLLIGQTNQGMEIHGTLVSFTRFSAVIELYSPALILRTSEVLHDVKIVLRDRTIYSGRAVVRSLVHSGMVTVCELTLNENCWTNLGFDSEMIASGALRAEFETFLHEWQKLYTVVPEFKVVMADMQSFMSDLRLWLDQVELEIRSSPSGDRIQLERGVIDNLAQPVVSSIDAFIERFEAIVGGLAPEFHPVHRNYMRRLLHPLVLSSPFAYRAFHKPLGFAGDYEMVEMMLRPPYEGSTLFAKLINVWLLGQTPALAHRNRIAYLTESLSRETMRARKEGKVARIFDLGCGPAAEVQQFLQHFDFADHADLTLLDFDHETLQHLRGMLEDIRAKTGCRATVRLVRKSVHQILKESGKSVAHVSPEQYDYVYCAGLFDYLSDQVCSRLMNIFYDQLAPGGLLLATNASDTMNSSRPFRYSMEYLLDWHLNYRTGKSLAALAPDRASPESISIFGEDSGVNLFIEVRKPQHA